MQFTFFFYFAAIIISYNPKFKTTVSHIHTYTHLPIYLYKCIYLPTPPSQAGCDTRSIFLESSIELEFSVYLLDQ